MTFTPVADAVVERLPMIDGTSLKVYLAVAWRSKYKGECWPSVETLSKDTGVSERMVQYSTARLAALGLLTSEVRPGQSTLYRVTHATRCTPTATGGETDCTLPTQPIASGGATGCVQPTQPVAPRTRIKNKNTKARASEVVADFAAWWEAYPRKVAKEAARKAYAAAVGRIMGDDHQDRGAAVAKLLEAVGAFADSKQGRGELKFIPYPATWLNAGRYDDQADTRNEEQAERVFRWND